MSENVRKDQQKTRPRFVLPPLSYTVDKVGPMSLETVAGETERRFDMKFTRDAAQDTIDELQRQLDGKSDGSGMVTVSFWGRSKQQ